MNNEGNFSYICKWKAITATVDRVDDKNRGNYEQMEWSVLKLNFKEILWHTNKKLILV